LSDCGLFTHFELFDPALEFSNAVVTRLGRMD